MGSVVAPSGQKLLGAYYTPPALAEFLTSWAVRHRTDRVLEPAAGEAVFLVSAVKRLVGLGAEAEELPGQVAAFDIDASAAQSGSEVVQGQTGVALSVKAQDFFRAAAPGTFDAAIGNPPWIRYHLFDGAGREQAQRLAEAVGVEISGLASSWAAFVVHAASFLKADGRLAFVLPAELLTTDYAEPVRQWLVRRFARVRVVTFKERVFPGALVDAVLLMAEGLGPGSVEIVDLRSSTLR